MRGLDVRLSHHVLESFRETAVEGDLAVEGAVLQSHRRYARLMNRRERLIKMRWAVFAVRWCVDRQKHRRRSLPKTGRLKIRKIGQKHSCEPCVNSRRFHTLGRFSMRKRMSLVDVRPMPIAVLQESDATQMENQLRKRDNGF